MRTQLMIALIVGACVVAVSAMLAGLVWWLGWAGVIAWVVLVVVVALTYAVVLRPWHLRWGATDEEVALPMPGDELIRDARSATRAITIRATPAEVWPWLVQLGYGKAGWYSYDWIDNDFRPSADRILPELQSLRPGDKILMMPDVGFVVDTVEPPHAIVSVLEDGSTSWSLVLYPTEGGTRLVSRWRPNLEMTLRSFLMSALAEPGTFVMEQKMLRTIRDRVEASSARSG